MKRTSVSLADARRAWRLLGDARDARDRPEEQAVAMVDGLCRLFGGDNGFHIRFDDYRPGGRVAVSRMHYGTVFDPTLDRWFQGRLGFEPAMNDDLMVVHSIARTQRTTVLTQSQLWPRTDPNAFPRFAQIIQSYQLHDNLVMMFRPGHGTDAIGFAVHRRDSVKPFTTAQRQLAKLMAVEMRRLNDAGQLTAPPSPTAGLPRRSAEVLQRLLAGQSPKQIATTLGLSIFTVRDHVKYLLDHFTVSSTQELLAKLLGSGNDGR